MSLTINSADKQKQTNEATMSATLKQRTWMAEGGRAVHEGHPDARFLVGPAGSSVSTETALSLGLIDGAISDAPQPPRIDQVSEKTTPHVPIDMKRPDPDSIESRLQATMGEMIIEAEVGGDIEREKLFTSSGKPDARVLSGRLETEITAAVRDQAWAVYQANDAILDAEADADDGTDADAEADAADNDDDPI